MNRFLSFLAIIVVFASVSSSVAQDNLSKFNARISVSVSADENLKSTVSSYINRELRSLRDVEIVDRNPEWEIHIIAMEVETKAGRKAGIALSVVILSNYNNQLLLSLVPASSKEMVNSLTTNLYYSSDNSLRVGSTEDTRAMCTEIVADFDTKHLEESRKVHRQIMDSIQEMKKEDVNNP